MLCCFDRFNRYNQLFNQFPNDDYCPIFFLNYKNIVENNVNIIIYSFFFFFPNQSIGIAEENA